MHSETNHFELAVEAPLMGTLTYQARSSCAVQRGDSVTVPLGRRREVRGVIIGSHKTSPTLKTPTYQMKLIDKLNLKRPALFEAHLQWLEWLAYYYVHPLGQVVQLAFAPLDKKTKATPETELTTDTQSGGPAKSFKKPLTEPPGLASVIPPLSSAPASAIQLNDTQLECVQGILNPKVTEEAIDQKATKQNFSGFRVHLLQGVTGSGKTEVYLKLFEHCLAQGRQGLMLTPEIALTPQLLKKFTQRFGDKVAVMHSQLTARQKTNQWWDVVEGRRKILIGVRSALFCPIPKLGLIVVDEEHEASFKQDSKLKYHGRDAAIVLAQKHNIPLVLGSATPSLESLHKAQQGHYFWHKMPHRIGGNKLPKVQVIDLSSSASKPASTGRPFWMSELLHTQMQQCLHRNEQVALFLNRRGMARQQLCQTCSEVAGCPNCDISLTLHGQHYLVCHYCEYSKKAGGSCAACGSSKIIALGLGTEAVEKDVKNLFPEVRVMRADRDEITNRKQLENLILKMEQREVDILVGTQMIAKGLDFEHLSLAGLILADTSFNLPDFRAPERAFQLMVQMSGRAGRKRPGQVVIQAYNPLHPSVVCAQKHDYFAFARQELQARQELYYPPFGRICILSLEGSKENTSHKVALELKEKISHLQKRWPGLKVLGPAPAPIFKLCNKYRYHILLKALKGQRLSAFCHALRSEYNKMPARGTRLQINIDPQN